MFKFLARLEVQYPNQASETANTHAGNGSSPMGLRKFTRSYSRYRGYRIPFSIESYDAV